MGALETNLVLPLASIAAPAHQHYTKIYTTVTPTYLIQPLCCSVLRPGFWHPLLTSTPQLSYSQRSGQAASNQHPKAHIHPCSNKGKPRVLLDHEAGSLLAPLRPPASCPRSSPALSLQFVFTAHHSSLPALYSRRTPGLLHSHLQHWHSHISMVGRVLLSSCL